MKNEDKSNIITHDLTEYTRTFYLIKLRLTHPTIYKRECSHVNNKLYFTNFIFNKIEKQSFFADTFFKWKIAFYFSFYHRYQWMILKFVFFGFLFVYFLQDNQGTHPGNFFRTYHPKVIYNIIKQFRFDIPTITNIELVHLYQMCLQILDPIE